MITKKNRFRPDRVPLPPEDRDEPPPAADAAADLPDDFDLDEAKSFDPVVVGQVLIDTSGSTSTEGPEIQAAADSAVDDVRRDEVAAETVDLEVVTFGGHVAATGFAPAGDLKVPRFKFGGGTPMGRAVDTAVTHFEERLREHARNGSSVVKGVILVFSDGHPSDEYEAAFARLRSLEKQLPWLDIYPVAVGHAAVETMALLSGKKKPALLKDMNFRGLFDWFSDSLRRHSRSRKGQKVTLARPDDWMQ